MGRIILYIMENKKCLKPPTSHGFLPDWMGTQWMFIVFLMGIQWISLWDFREIWTISVKKTLNTVSKREIFQITPETPAIYHMLKIIYVFSLIYPHVWLVLPLFPGWWLTYPSEKYEFVSWDDDSQLNGKITHLPTTNQFLFFLKKPW